MNRDVEVSVEWKGHKYTSSVRIDIESPLTALRKQVSYAVVMVEDLIREGEGQ